MTAIAPFVSSTTSQGLNWSFLPAWLLILTGVPHEVPPFVERENQMRVLQAEVVEDPGSFEAVVHPVSPERSVQSA